MWARPGGLRLAAVLVLMLAVVSAGWCDNARLVRYSGTVKIQRSGSGPWYKIGRTNSRALYPGDHLQTAQRSSAVIAIGGAQVTLGARTHVVIPTGLAARRGNNRLRTVFGHVWVWLIGGRSLELGSDVAVASAHGTKFVVDTDEDGTMTVTVVEGTVTLSSEWGEVSLAPDEQSVAKRGAAPTRPVQVDTKAGLYWDATLDSTWLPWELQPDLGDLAGQEETDRASLVAAPGDADAQLRLGWVLLAQGQAGAAYANAAKVTATPPQQALILVQGAVAACGTGQADAPKLQQGLAQAAQLDPQQPLVPLAQGFVALRTGDAAGARRALEQALALDPKLYQAHAYLATVDLAERQPDVARKHAEQAVALAPNSGLARESLATVKFFAGDAPGARRELDAALAANPNSATACLLSSDLYAQAGDLSRAQDEAQAAISLDPKLAPAWSALGFLFLAGNDLRSAHKSFQLALELAPQQVAARTGMGVTYAREGRLAQALQASEGAVALDSSNLSARNNLGVTYLDSGQLEQAREQFEAIIAEKPDWSVPHENLAITWLELQRYADALREGALAVRLGSDSPRAHTTLARVYLRENRAGQAWAELRRALDLDERFALAHLEMAEVYNRIGKPPRCPAAPTAGADAAAGGDCREPGLRADRGESRRRSRRGGRPEDGRAFVRRAQHLLRPRGA